MLVLVKPRIALCGVTSEIVRYPRKEDPSLIHFIYCAHKHLLNK